VSQNFVLGRTRLSFQIKTIVANLMDITATITGITYQPLLAKKLKEYDIDTFDVNRCPKSCLIINDNQLFSLSKWISPKRTRSYPYEGIYDTLTGNKKITVIPVVKDEGHAGDRDFIQWDTISLMSLLDVYVILAYYDRAQKNVRFTDKITAQCFDNQYIIQKISELQNYHSSALHWNLKETKENLASLLNKATLCYTKMSETLGVKMHSEIGIHSLQERIHSDLENFMRFSREKSEKAQFRESRTQQPKESLSTLTKGMITITNYLGGKYFFTVDEVFIENDKLYLTESKHSKMGFLPSKSDIKDGLLKMVLYSNLQTVSVSDVLYRAIPVLRLTSPRISHPIDSYATVEQLKFFISTHSMSKNQAEFLTQLFAEAQKNQFKIVIEHGVSG